MWPDVDRSKTRDVVQDIYIRRGREVDGALYSVEFETFKAINDQPSLQTNSPDFPKQEALHCGVSRDGPPTRDVPRMIAIDQLRYVRLGTRDLGASVDFAQRILGLELVEQDSTQAAFRSDFRDHTLVFTNDMKPAQTIGFEVRDVETLERAADALARNGHDITRGTPEEAARRKVKSLLSFADASGVTIDLVVRPLHSGWRYFPSRDAGITGLRRSHCDPPPLRKARRFGPKCSAER